MRLLKFHCHLFFLYIIKSRLAYSTSSLSSHGFLNILIIAIMFLGQYSSIVDIKWYFRSALCVTGSRAAYSEHMYMCMYMCVHVYIYVYIYMYTCMCNICICIYVLLGMYILLNFYYDQIWFDKNKNRRKKLVRTRGKKKFVKTSKVEICTRHVQVWISLKKKIY